MATYEELSEEDKKIVDNMVNMIRAGCGEIARVFNHLVAIANDTNAINLVLSIGATDVIPNTSGLAGADSMTRAEIQAIYTTLNTIRSTFDTSGNRAAWSKAAGINALLG